MKFDPQKHHRRSTRLKEYDYAQSGAYFTTIVTYQRDLLFGKIVDEEMELNELGKIADECWRAIPDHSFSQCGIRRVRRYAKSYAWDYRYQ